VTRRVPAAPRLVLDSGAVIALAQDDPGARAVLSVALRRGIPVYVPAVVVTETVRGGPRDAPVNRLLKAVGEVVVVTEALARTAGGLLGATGSAAGAADAQVIATVLFLGGGVVLTSDPKDLTLLARDSPQVMVQTV
jgi:predicted nucleic acid-binding protein